MSPYDHALDYAIQAIERGDRQKGHAALSWLLKRQPENTLAWLWMASCVPDEFAKQECYRRVSVLSAGS